MVIIQFDEYLKQRKKSKKMRANDKQPLQKKEVTLDDIIEDARQTFNKNKSINLRDVDEVADKILSIMDGYNKEGSTPVINLATRLGFETFHQDLGRGLSGFIKIDQKLEKIYGTTRVIAVNYKESLEHLRFVIAHELGHFIFEYDGHSPKYSNTYRKNMHTTDSERVANRFAAELLMPRDLFIEQYNYAKKINQNKLFILVYLSDYFKTTYESIEKRIEEVI